MDTFAYLCIWLLACSGVVISESLRQPDAENAEVLVKESSTTEELIDLICSCREQVDADSIRPRDCFEIKENGNTKSGIYTIYPSLSTERSDPVDVWCDMDTDGGGWTVLQKRNDGSVDFNRGWEEYKSGFGYLGSEYWLGNDVIFTLSNQINNEIWVDLEDSDGAKHYTRHGHFRVGDESTGYKLHVNPASKNQEKCQDVVQLGMEDGRIKDSQISASTEYSAARRAINARLNRPAGSWSAQTNDANQWIQVDLGYSTTFSGVITQGRSEQDQWITKFKVEYYDEDGNWNFVKDSSDNDVVFNGNSDRNTLVTNRFPAPVRAQIVRIRPTAWHNHMSMRFEVLGCDGDSLSAKHNFQPFSTQDVDNAPNEGSGCVENNGPWWYGPCDSTGFNGNYRLRVLTGTRTGDFNDGAYQDNGIAWKDFKGSSHFLTKTEIKIRPVV